MRISDWSSDVCSSDLGLNWDNVAERMAPELKVDILPEWVVAEYRAHFPNWSPRDVFWGATTAGRSWRGQVIEAEARARAGTPPWGYQVGYASAVEPARGAFTTLEIPRGFGTVDWPGGPAGRGE